MPAIAGETSDATVARAQLDGSCRTGHTGDIETPDRPTTVVSNSAIAPTVRLLALDYRPEFRPGQCVALSLGEDVRYYSIASAPGDGTLEVLYDLLPHGALTPRLSTCRSGDTVFVSQPFGSFVLEESGCGTDSAAVTWIATGTGVAPFVSMTRTLWQCEGGITDVRLLHGSRTVAGLYFGEELSRALGSRYVPCMSVPPLTDEERDTLARWNAYQGRLTELLRHEGGDPKRRYYLCGSAAMVVDVRDLLLSLSVPFDNIFSEIYF